MCFIHFIQKEINHFSYSPFLLADNHVHSLEQPSLQSKNITVCYISVKNNSKHHSNGSMRRVNRDAIQDSNVWCNRLRLTAAEDNINVNPQQSLPEEIGHVCVGTVDRTKPGQQSHECDSNHTNTTDQLLNGQDAWTKENKSPLF